MAIVPDLSDLGLNDLSPVHEKEIPKDVKAVICRAVGGMAGAFERDPELRLALRELLYIEQSEVEVQLRVGMSHIPMDMASRKTEYMRGQCDAFEQVASMLTDTAHMKDLLSQNKEIQES